MPESSTTSETVLPELTARQQAYLDRFTDMLLTKAQEAGRKAQLAAEAAGEEVLLFPIHKPDISSQLRAEFQAVLAPDIAKKNAQELDQLEAKLDLDLELDRTS